MAASAPFTVAGFTKLTVPVRIWLGFVYIAYGH